MRVTSQWGNLLVEAGRVAADISGLLGVEVDAAAVLTGRAAIMNLPRPGRISAGGATRLLRAVDGWCAVALPRDDDVAALPALMEVDAVTSDHWSALSRWTATHSTVDVVNRAQLLGIAAAALGEAAAEPPEIRRCAAGLGTRPANGLLVADLSSLWAGPLCGQLLARAGAVVVKVESPSRPDGTRRGPSAFFDWMNAGKLSYAADFDVDGDAVRRLLSAADIVIEGSRPAALQRRGLVGGGADGPEFCGDAIADPLSGLEAARVVGESLHRGGGEVIEVSMAQVAARYAALPASSDSGEHAGPPALPSAGPSAPLLGADNTAVERLVAERLCASC